MTENADVIFVGNKPPMSYVLAIITSLSSGKLNEITLKARGQAITTAVDVAEIARNRFIKDLKVTKSQSEQQRCPLVRVRTSPEWFPRWR
jgi:archaea-specific DNA-binding protein